VNTSVLSGTTAFLLLLSFALGAAHDPFAGYFVDEQRTVAVQMENFEGTYSGVMTDGESVFYELTARSDGGRLVGEVVADGQPVPFVAENHGGFLVYRIEGVGYKFYRFEPEATTETQPSHGTQGQQQPQAANPQPSPQLGGAAGQIARSRLYWNQKRSIIASSGGAYGEIDFCSNGYFWDSSESSVNVQVRDYTGDTLASAGAASAGTYTGRWNIEQRDGQPSLVLYYGSGGTYYYYLSTVMGGSWRDGSYKYAMEWGTSRCQ
jgi:hypothetical protein